MRKTLLAFFALVCTLSLTAQTDYNWVQQTLNPDDNLQGMAIMQDSSILVAGYNTVFMKSTDFGQSWSPVMVVDATFDYAALSFGANGNGLLSTRRTKLIDYKTGEDMYIDGRLLKTADYGATWTIMSLDGFTSDVLETDPNKVAAYAFDLYFVECVNADTMYAYAGWYNIITGSKVSQGAVFKTYDGGANWTAISGDLKSNVITAIKTSGDNTYIAGNNTFLKKSGETITDIYPALVAGDGGTDQTIYIFDIDVVGDDEFYVATSTNGLFYSNDGGATITELGGTGIPSGGNDIKKIADNTIMVMGTTSKSKVTTDNGATWVDCNTGLSIWEIAGVFNDSVVVLAKDVILKLALTDLTSSPKNWVSQTITTIGTNLQQMSIIDENTAIIAGNDQVASITSDKGLSWSELQLPALYEQGSDDAEYPIDFTDVITNDSVSYLTARRVKWIDFPSDSSQLDTYFPGPTFISYDNFTTWSLLDATAFGAATPDDVSQNPFNASCDGFDPYTISCVTDSIVFVWAQWYDFANGIENKTDHSRIFKSVDNGSSWTVISDDFGSKFIKAIHFTDPDNGYIAGNSMLFKTTDGGTTLEDLYPEIDPDGSLAAFFNSLAYYGPDEIYLPSTNDGVWKVTEGGTNFSTLNTLVGSTDLMKVNDTVLIVLGSKDKSFVSKDSGETWEACSPGVSIWAIGGVVRDTIFALTKGDIYKLAIGELTYVEPDEPDGITNVLKDNSIKVLNRQNEIEIMSTDKEIEMCALYSISGQMLESNKPMSTSCIFDKTAYQQGLYIVTVTTDSKTSTYKVIF